MEKLPFISILIAARNEAENIRSCLQHVAELSYPHYEVLVGNDQSEDNTAQIVRGFIADKPHFQLIDIKENVGLAKGKANVLAQLARQAQGDFLLITDADVQVSKNWIQAIIAPVKPKTGLSMGCTIPKGNTWFGKMQALDWVQALAALKLCSDWGLPLTAMGNNLLVRKEAYLSVGGYENIPFSVTEDFELFRQLRGKGWQSVQVYNREVLASTKPVDSYYGLLQQRKRWMHGAIQSPWYILLGLGAYAGWLPFIILLILFQPIAGIGLWLVKFSIQAIWASASCQKLGQSALIPYLPLYELYSGLLNLILPIFYFLPIPVIWKGRQF